MISDPTATVPRSDAQRRCQQIHLLLESMTRQKEKVLFLVTEAKEHDDHLALGYPSWPAYVSAEFTAALTDLTRDDRRWFAFALSQTAMSSRAIAPIVGVTDRQVRLDVAQLAQVGNDFPPDVEQEIQQYAVSEEAFVEDYGMRPDEADALISSGLVTNRKEFDEIADKIRDDPTPERTVVGLDGKRYPSPSPKPKTKPGQKATPGAFWDAAYEFQKKLTTLENVVKRASFPRNRKVIRDKHLGELIRQSNRLKVVISALSDPVDEDDPR